MTDIKQRIFRRFEREAKKKNQALKKAGLTCICGECDLATFRLQEIKDIIFLKEELQNEK